MSLRDNLSQHSPSPRHYPRPDILCCENIPKPMHGLAPRVVLGEEWWDRTRRAAYRSTLYHCAACGVHASEAKERQALEGHELYNIDYARGRMVYVETVPLCHYCHNFIHDGRLLILLMKGQISQKKYDTILRHGSRLLKKAGLKRSKVHHGPIAAWRDWRLVIEGVEYPPLIKDYQEWESKYGRNQP